ncbi:MAG: NFACT family protein [Candidatus Marsarchaeota archaeon]|jgi:predicted ribosome quality control (RQC) complex YloA/Tae2 family protein|nr:NFACT family protein [Candidatus Marsarchaeota archaeon]MCL5111905.1 NFACT family protein [Candidatus Marsarchaeota archaeon]
MRFITAPELSVLAKELQELAGSRIARFYEVEDGRFRVRVKRGKESIDMQIMLSHAINRTRYTEKQGSPTDFAMAVRKRIEGSTIESIRQINDDRILEIDVRKGDKHLGMILEMFGQGNLIIVDSGMDILLAYRRRQFRGRRIDVGEVYAPPRQAEGYKMELPNEIRVALLLNGQGKAVDYTIDGGRNDDVRQKIEFGTLQEALDRFYYENRMDERNEPVNEAEKQLRLSIEKQRRLLKGTESDIETNKEIADKIFSNMEAINSMIAELKKNRRITKEELQLRTGRIKVIELDLKEKRATIDVD